MRFGKKIWFLVCVAGSLKSQTTNYFGVFPTIDHSADLSGRFSYNVYIFDAVKPYSNTINQMKDQARSFYFYFESGLSYSIKPKLSVTASYVYQRPNTFNSDFSNENRAFQQITYKPVVGKSELKFRLRFDERFIQDRVTGKSPLTHRLRFLAGIKRDLKENKIYLMAYSEFFFNTTSNAKYVYNENWSAAQLGFNLNSKNSIEAGLLFVGWINNSKGDWLNQYYLQLTWCSHLNFKKS